MQSTSAIAHSRGSLNTCARACQGVADRRNDRQLARLGYRVLRLPAELVLEQLPVAVERVRVALAEP